jgi:hypothetical protein
MNKKEKPVETMLVLAMACLLAYVAFHWKAGLYLSFVAGGIGIFSNYLSARIAWVWMGLARALGRVTNGLLLSAVFLMIVTPVSFFRRIFGKDKLTRFDPKATSNFVSREHLFTKEDLEKTW